jgi:hypothetical protein
MADAPRPHFQAATTYGANWPTPADQTGITGAIAKIQADDRRLLVGSAYWRRKVTELGRELHAERDPRMAEHLSKQLVQAERCRDAALALERAEPPLVQGGQGRTGAELSDAAWTGLLVVASVGVLGLIVGAVALIWWLL